VGEAEGGGAEFTVVLPEALEEPGPREEEDRTPPLPIPEEEPR
jgi:two-component system CitB family sensor kinase